MSGKELDPDRFSRNSPWRTVRELLLKDKSFYLGELAKVNLFDPPAIAQMKRRCRIGHISEKELEEQMAEFFAANSTETKDRYEQTSARGYSLKTALRRDAEKEAKRQEAAKFSGGYTPRGGAAVAPEVSVATALAMASGRKGKADDDDDDAKERPITDDGHWEMQDIMRTMNQLEKYGGDFEPIEIDFGE